MKFPFWLLFCQLYISLKRFTETIQRLLQLQILRLMLNLFIPSFEQSSSQGTQVSTIETISSKVFLPSSSPLFFPFLKKALPLLTRSNQMILLFLKLPFANPSFFVVFANKVFQLLLIIHKISYILVRHLKYTGKVNIDSFIWHSSSQSFILQIMSDSQDHPSSILYSQDTSEYERNKESVISEEQAQANKGSLAVEMSENGQFQHEVNNHKGSLYIKKKEYEEVKEEEQHTNEHIIQKPVKYEGELISYSPQTSHISANNSTINVLAKHVEIFNNIPVSSLMQYDQDQQMKQPGTVKSEEKVEMENQNVEYSDEDYHRESYTSNTPVNSGIKREKKSQLVEDNKKVGQVDTNANRYESQGSSEDQREKQQKQQSLKEQHELKKEKEIVHVEYTQKKQEKKLNENYTNSSPEDSSQMLINLTKDKQAFKKQSSRDYLLYTKEINQSRNYLPNTGPNQYHQEEVNQSKYSEECKLDLLANLKVVPVGSSQYSQKQVQRKLFQTNLDKDSLVIIEKKQDEYVAIQPSPSQANMQSLRHESMRIPKSPIKPVPQIKQQPQGKRGKACSCQLI